MVGTEGLGVVGNVRVGEMRRRRRSRMMQFRSAAAARRVRMRCGHVGAVSAATSAVPVSARTPRGRRPGVVVGVTFAAAVGPRLRHALQLPRRRARHLVRRRPRLGGRDAGRARRVGGDVGRGRREPRAPPTTHVGVGVAVQVLVELVVLHLEVVHRDCAQVGEVDAREVDRVSLT